jgi:hypothetical protein
MSRPFIPVREVIVYCPNSGIWNAMTPALNLKRESFGWRKAARWIAE